MRLAEHHNNYLYNFYLAAAFNAAALSVFWLRHNLKVSLRRNTNK
jgi:hypothetical protein